MSAVALPPRPAEALAHRESDCPLCPHRIHRGDPIKLTTEALGWAHSDCANDYFDVYPEHAPGYGEEAA